MKRVVAKKIWHGMPLGTRKAVRSLVGDKNFRAAQRMVSGRESQDYGLLSVVIPVFNVELYLDECIKSVIDQNYENIEIIIIDDGSTDRSPEIIDKYRRLDKRIKVLSIKNSGNGIARNLGIAQARGKYLTFADSDDIVLRDAYTTMLGQLAATGSDFVCGSFQRILGKKKWTPKGTMEIHSADRLGVNVESFPEIIHDIFLWNKIFRIDFWRESIGSIPEGILYEDQETIIRAFLRSRSFDILKKPVYIWRLRSDGSSITQQKSDIRDLTDRMVVARNVSALVAREAGPAVQSAWYRKLVGPDLSLYIGQVPRTDDEYWSLLHTEVKKIVGLFDPRAVMDLTVNERMLLWLVLESKRSDIGRLLIHNQEYGLSYVVETQRDNLHAAPASLSTLESDIPSYLFELSANDLKLVSKMTSYDWTDSSTLEINGYAFIRNLDTARFASEITVSLVSEDRNVRFPLIVERSTDNSIDQVVGDRWNSYSKSKFRAVLDINGLGEVGGGFLPSGQDWTVEVSVTAGNLSLSGPILSKDKEAMPQSLDMIGTVNESRIVGLFDGKSGLRLRLVTYNVSASGIRIQGRQIFVDLDTSDSNLQYVELKNTHGVVVQLKRDTSSKSTSSWVGELPPMKTSAGPAVEDSWLLLSGASGPKRSPIGWTESSAALDTSIVSSSTLVPSVNGYGYLRVLDRRWRIVVTNVTAIDTTGELTIEGVYTPDGNSSSASALPRLTLATGRDILDPVSSSLDMQTGQYSLVFSFKSDRWGFGEVVVPSGAYSLRCAVDEQNSTKGNFWVPIRGELGRKIPTIIDFPMLRIGLSATEAARALVIKFGAPFAEGDRGNFRQNEIRRSFASVTSGLKNIALFESFGGKSATDSVRAIHSEVISRSVDTKSYWTVKDYSVAVPDGATPVLMYSREWYDVLNSARVLVNNNNFPHFFRKKSGQKYIQTWHGTPLKRIGNDAPKRHLSLSYLNLMQRESGYWDVLLAQTEYAGGLLGSAFGYDGRIEALGYPRNDILLGDHTKVIAARLRERLNISPDAKVVLYAPTWRDNVKSVSQQYDLVTYLDFSKIKSRFGDNVVILLRGHHNIAAQRFTAGNPAFIDVTDYPEINHLYLAADVLVTDYSSAMFDFAVTKKPMIFLVPDIELYRDKTRGFYFDLESVAPGPLVRTTEEVISILEVIGKEDTLFTSKYEEFVGKFSSLDDGFAAARVVDAVWPFQ